MQVSQIFFHNNNALLWKTRYSRYSFCCSQSFSCHLKANMRLSISAQYSNLGSISHRLATVARNGLHSHLRSMISISSDRAYAMQLPISDYCYISTQTWLVQIHKYAIVTFSATAQWQCSTWRHYCISASRRALFNWRRHYVDAGHASLIFETSMTIILTPNSCIVAKLNVIHR